ncbi:MAG: hypothetical protein ABW328_13210 [Ilumatobacteraceae bacterium]
MGDIDLRTWIRTEHDGALARFEQSVVAAVPRERWTDPAGTGGSSIAYLAFHTAYHEDLAINAVLGGAQPLAATWRDDLGLGLLAPTAGLGETEVPELTAALDLDRLVPYVRAVHAASAAIIDAVDLGVDVAPDAGPIGLTRAGVDDAAVPWLHAMWTAKPASWFVQWEAVGHRINHLGEMVSVRNRMGLSPF